MTKNAATNASEPCTQPIAAGRLLMPPEIVPMSRLGWCQHVPPLPAARQPCAGSEQPLVEVRDIDVLDAHEFLGILPTRRMMVRSDVATRLLLAERLLPSGFGLVVRRLEDDPQWRGSGAAHSGRCSCRRGRYAGFVGAAGSSFSVPCAGSYLGRGIYDVAEVARLIRRSRRRVEGWTRAGAESVPLLSGELDGLFSFWDLLSLRVVGELVERGVPRSEIARGAGYLALELGTHRPFAHEGLATVGRGFFADMGSWVDVGMGGQQAFQIVVEPLLEPITFNDSGMAAIWRPHARVWVNPEVQAGAPCVDGTRIPTGTLAELQRAGLGIEELSDDYQLSSEQVQAAIAYEASLAA